jgi:hypothetical protein
LLEIQGRQAIRDLDMLMTATSLNSKFYNISGSHSNATPIIWFEKTRVVSPRYF